MTEKIPTLLNKVYILFMDVMFQPDNPLDLLDQFVVEDVMGYGTTIDEKIFDLKGLKDLAILQRKQSPDLGFNYELIPVYRKMMNEDHTAIIVDEIKISIQIEDEEVSFLVRMSSVWELIEEHWKIVHWHGSKPEYDSGGTDTWHTEEWQKKNEELQKQVEEKAAELIQKNHKLEVEAALERVRAKAMSMQKPDDLLEVCQIISEQLETLNLKNIRNVQVAIIDESRKNYANYQYFTAYSKPVFEETDYTNNPAAYAMITEMKKSANSFFIGSIKDEQLKEFKAWRNKDNQFLDSLLDKSEEVYYYFYSIGKGGLGLTTYKEISNESLDIFKRFHKVFTLAYSRFMDIQKAAAQAREAEIQLALERVRARTMAMQQSDELPETASLMAKQLKGLGEEIDQITIGIFKEEENLIQAFGTVKGDQFQTLDVPIEESFVMGKVYRAWKSGKKSLIVKLSGEQLIKYNIWRNNFLKKNIYPIDNPDGTWFVNAAMFSKGLLSFSSDKQVSQEANELLERFSAVFDLTYTRFLDLKTAEAQAREAKIEAALERVRAQMMAMHQSDELRKVIGEVFSQLQGLGFDAPGSALIIYDDNLAAEHWMTGYSHEIYPESYKIPYTEHPYFKDLADAWQNGSKYQEFGFEGELKIEYAEWLIENSDFARLPAEFKKEMKNPDRIIMCDAFNKYGMLEIMSPKSLSEDNVNILKRFSYVFEQTYTRFLDLKKAEAQAREAQIEAALERVRSKSIGMQKSDELKDVIHVIYDQFVRLGINVDHTGFIVDYKKRDDMLIWLADQNGPLTKISIPYFNSPHWNSFVEVKKKGTDFFVNQLDFETKNKFYKKLFKFIPELPEASKKFYFECPGLAISTVLLDSVGLYIENFSGTPYSDEENKILMRFGKVFQQSYTRFLDLEKAEAQTREAQIEASLEKVRGVALSLQKSDEMLQVAQVLYEQLLELGFSNIRNAIIDINNGEGDTFTDYDYSHEMSGTITQMSYHDDPTLEGQFKKMATTTNDFFELILEGKELEDLKKMRIKNGEAPDPRLDKIDLLTYNLYSFGNGAIGISNFGVLSDDEKTVLARFSNVFTFAYKRYIDMVQAEHQAREALIELSLERIRAQVTAMQESTELLDIVVTMQTEFNKLGHEAHYFWHMRWLPNKYEKALTNGDGDRIGNVLELPRGFHGLKNMMDWENSDEPTAVFALEPDVAADYIDKMIKLGRFQEIDHSAPGPDEVVAMGGLTFVMARTTHGEIGYTLPGVVPHPPDEDIATLARFAGVFDLAYRRFEDLKSAERQNRETQIELALERVRSKTMAMHNSQDVGDTVITLFNEVLKLGLDKSIRVGIGILEGNKGMETWSATSNPAGEVDLKMGMLDMTIHPMLIGLVEAWKSGKTSYSYDYIGDDVFRYYQALNNEPKYPFQADLDSLPENEYHKSFFYSEGILFSFAPNPISDEAAKVLDRFARVFGQTYRRYRDLQKAEKQAKEAVKQASLDRIRGQIASMRNANDLQQITPLIWNELKTLEVPFFRCGVFIIDENKKHIQVYLTTPDGKPLGALDLDFKANDLTKDTVANWKKGKVYQTHWNKEEFIAWTQEMMKLRQIKKPKKYQGAEEPPESLHLHFIPFAQGMLYVGHEVQLEKEKIDLVKSLAEAFSFAYARYEDFVVLEEAKERIEKALSDLKATQSQLVHAEKMASLGELTAGIAHEIQNPLNFVNNFSEVSTDLIEELKEELQNGDTEEVNAIAKDLLQNLQKINHHGNRASGIVKSMLEHSRAGSDDKVPTDLNVLADEYLRLAYHGLRAKDKKFNADFKLEADKSLPKVDVVAQDIGRVMLNLINNAFHAVSSKALATEDSSRSVKTRHVLSQQDRTLSQEGGSSAAQDYKPHVSVTTKNMESKIEIRIRDNGNGIPEDIRDKIFQPFFTTKPTGEGTGLGLSLSYDIITKGHGGELSVVSEDRKGTEFMISLPVK